MSFAFSFQVGDAVLVVLDSLFISIDLRVGPIQLVLSIAQFLAQPRGLILVAIAHRPWFSVLPDHDCLLSGTVPTRHQRLWRERELRCPTNSANGSGHDQ